MSLNLFIIGPSGCGKSTQAKLLAEKYHLTHLSMGQLLRDEVAANSPLGIEAKSYLDAGVWTPDSLVIKLLCQKLAKIDNQNFIVDGFPRMLNQAIEIENYLTAHHQSVSLLIHLDVTFAEIQARRAKAGTSFQTDRSDLTPEAIASRQKSYQTTIDPIIAFFQPKNLLFNVDGNRPIDPIFNDICLEIKKLTE